MHVVIIGNGILGLVTGYRIWQRDPTVKITIVGPNDQKGCASLAAAAMLNSFCEVDGGTLGNIYERTRFLFNRQAAPLWPAFLDELGGEKDSSLAFGFGTFLINNHATDDLEDENFEAIVAALEEFDEPFHAVEPRHIENFKPSARERAARAIFIPREGWVNPVILISTLRSFLRNSADVDFVDNHCHSISKSENRIDHLRLESGETIQGDSYLLAPGATFSKILGNSNLGLTMPRIFFGIGCSLLLRTATTTLANCIRTPNRGLACGVYAAPHDKNHTLVGASNFISPEPSDFPHATSVLTLLQSSMEQINSDYYRSQLVRVNLGWRPTSEDTFPLLGETSISNLFVATGTKRDGFHCSPLIANLLADLILDGSSRIEYSLFRPERTAIRSLSRADAIRTAVRHTINASYQHGFVPAKNRMIEELEKYHSEDLNRLHDRVGAIDWGIPPEMINMYRYGHIAL